MTNASSSSAMTRMKDEWMTAALMCDQMVAELLLRLKQAKTTASENPEVILPPFRWGVRQRRSRYSRIAGVFVAGGPMEKEADSVRGSPMTPLSWSGGSGSGRCSVSPSSAATADGFEGTSRQASCSTSAGSGSKALPANEIISSFSKRSKRKKTFPELKDEENLLLNERSSLEMEIATMRTNIKEQTATNEILKRIKFDLRSDCAIQDHDLIIESNLDQACNPIPSRRHETSLAEEEPISGYCRSGCSDGSFFFLLPDLNTVPSSEDDVCTETLYDAS
ncbi:PREDICTED: uncharacterized protein LOC104818603 [Tarenaya hassleriana]|uniref:uncharacterized protein LOC104818603 n=1 Tax=Tarenaya hassleriana TaxID=28532 RepID=UPI00053C110C|nr:PREDICTED: uncharacterized protein LOC104818603 [Tarenaya hassleriana]